MSNILHIIYHFANAELKRPLELLISATLICYIRSGGRDLFKERLWQVEAFSR